MPGDGTRGGVPTVRSGAMHMQIRVGLGHASSTNDTPGAMRLTPVEVDPLDLKAGALLDLLDLLADNGFDLGMAAGDSIEGGGEFVFALKDDSRYAECAELLKSNGYRNVRLIQPQKCEVDDRVGALRDCLRDIISDGRRIDEIYVGVPEEGKIPIQVTTIRTVS
jgi:hypothetical protein